MADETARERATRLIARGNPAGLLYGAIITGAVMSATANHVPSAARVVVASVFVLIVYWLADVYVRAFADQFNHGRSPLPRRMAAAIRHESRVLMGGVPAIVVVLVASLLGAETALAVDLALWLTVIELGAVGYLGARSAGSSPRTAFRESLAAALLGIVMVVSKTFLH
ncbi:MULTISPECIES: hypothetical protein [unclassified Terrabacter]|uniref:hypothetical protein n=1 Tax=unclassified Terrabacter TaxID=2630222 RepID=UPI0006FB5767|nr:MULTISPECIES: hypothetical protein [unclassified Terrabacter]KRB48010.1 hypothetical protein ASD90_06900 [Terrabacter sp. Root181]KRF40511.1 hypothetical protein ASG96_06470 [Terrabacter sp. Soil810]